MRLLLLSSSTTTAVSSFITRSSSSSSRAAVIGGTTSTAAFQHLSSAFQQQQPIIRSSSNKNKNNLIRLFSTTTTEEKSEEEKAAIKAAREARKAEKERKKAEKKAKKAAQQAALEKANRIDDVTFLNINELDTYPIMGDMTTIMSRSETNRQFDKITDKNIMKSGQSLWLRGRLHSIRVKGGSCFIVLRQDSFHTLQITYFKVKGDDVTPEQIEESQKMIKYLKSLNEESIVDVYGTLVDANVKSCSINNMEMQLQRIYCVSSSEAQLPFTIEDASRSEDDIVSSQDTDRPYPRLGQEIRLDHRWMDLRVPANNAIMKIQSGICQLFREYLYTQKFMEIHTPKLINGESESGAGVFTTDYFGTTACLAQSPQLYKQMAIASDMERVFEVGPVFRAENSNTRRHLCEFTGLDIEMSIKDHYLECLHVIHGMFKYIFENLETRYSTELEIIRKQYYSEPVQFTDDACIIHWPEAMEILENEGFDIGDGMNDMNGAMELALGKVIKEKYGTDFFMLDQYPSNIRPWYTMPNPNDPKFSNSYDIFIRGLEICSGAQRCHDIDMLYANLKDKGLSPEQNNIGDGLQKYIDSFKNGINPHAGAGIGLERVVFLYLNLDNVRKASMFPRDPNRCLP